MVLSHIRSMTTELKSMFFYPPSQSYHALIFNVFDRQELLFGTFLGWFEKAILPWFWPFWTHKNWPFWNFVLNVLKHFGMLRKSYPALILAILDTQELSFLKHFGMLRKSYPALILGILDTQELLLFNHFGILPKRYPALILAVLDTQELPSILICPKRPKSRQDSFS